MRKGGHTTRALPRAKPGFTIRGNRSGAAYVLAVTTLLVGVTLALAMLRSSSAGFISETIRSDKRVAANLAEAGVDYAFWQLHYNGAHLPYSSEVTLTTGSFKVDAVDDGSRDASMVLITSTGTAANGDKSTVRRTVLGLLPYHYAVCENGSFIDYDTVLSSGSGRGIRANGEIKLDSSSSNVSDGGWGTSTVWARGTITPKYPSSPTVRFPDIDFTYYYSKRDYYFSCDIYLNSPSASGLQLVVYVNGDVYVSGTYNGIFTIVSTGNIHITGNLAPSNSSSYIALIGFRDMYVYSSVTSVEAVMYCHSSASLGDIHIYGATTLTGAVCADNVTTDTTTKFTPSTRLNLAAMRQLRLPGL